MTPPPTPTPAGSPNDMDNQHSPEAAKYKRDMARFRDAPPNDAMTPLTDNNIKMFRTVNTAGYFDTLYVEPDFARTLEQQSARRLALLKRAREEIMSSINDINGILPFANLLALIDAEGKE